eukprot:438628-Amphidinium_carterae.1
MKVAERPALYQKKNFQPEDALLRGRLVCGIQVAQIFIAHNIFFAQATTAAFRHKLHLQVHLISVQKGKHANNPPPMLFVISVVSVVVAADVAVVIAVVGSQTTQSSPASVLKSAEARCCPICCKPLSSNADKTYREFHNAEVSPN